MVNKANSTNITREGTENSRGKSILNYIKPLVYLYQKYLCIFVLLEILCETVKQMTNEMAEKEEQLNILRGETIEQSNSNQMQEKGQTSSNSKQEFVNESNKQKVIKIESGYQHNPEHVIDDTKGGRSY